jgi:hypothetical protein
MQMSRSEPSSHSWGTKRCKWASWARLVWPLANAYPNGFSGLRSGHLRGEYRRWHLQQVPARYRYTLDRLNDMRGCALLKEREECVKLPRNRPRIVVDLQQVSHVNFIVQRPSLSSETKYQANWPNDCCSCPSRSRLDSYDQRNYLLY